MSPTLNLLVSSWAWKFLVRRTVFLSSGWVMRRSTFTTTVLLCLSLTTTPCSTRFGTLASLSLGGRSTLLQRLDAGDVSPDLAHPVGVLQLAGGPLEAQVELLSLQLEQFVLQLFFAHLLEVGCPLRLLHRLLLSRPAAARSAS